MAGELQTALLSEARDAALYAAVPGMGTAAAAIVLAIDGLNSLLGREKAPKLLGATPDLDLEMLEAAALEWNPALYRNAVHGQFRMLRTNKSTILARTPTGQRWLRYDALRDRVNGAYAFYLKRERDPDRAQALAMALREYLVEGWPLPNALADAFQVERSKWRAPPTGGSPLVTAAPGNVTTMPIPAPAPAGTLRVAPGYAPGRSVEPDDEWELPGVDLAGIVEIPFNLATVQSERSSAGTAPTAQAADPGAARGLSTTAAALLAFAAIAAFA